MKLYFFVLASIITTLLLCWSLEPLRSSSAAQNGLASIQSVWTQHGDSLVATRFISGVNIIVPNPGGYGYGWDYGWGYGGYRGGLYRLGYYNPYSYSTLYFPGAYRTPGYSYWRLPGRPLLMLSPNHQRHYFPEETSDHPPVPWEER